jgi:endoglucanase
MNRERRASLTLVGTLFGAMLVITAVLWLVLGRGSGSPDAAAPTEPARPTASAAGDLDPHVACTADFTVTGEWPQGFGAQLVVTSTAGTGEHWQITFDLSEGARVTELWPVTLLHDGADGAPVQVTAPDWDLDLAAGESVTIGFNGARGDATPQVGAVTLDGDVCGEPVEAPVAAPAGPVDGDGTFYVDTSGQSVDAAASATGEDRIAAQRIAGTAQALWIAGTDPGVARAQAADYTARAAAAGQTGVIAVYGIPGRDCGQHSAGGSAQDAYLAWVGQIADGITGEPWVVLEPDALAQLGDCDGQGDRAGLLRQAAALLDAAGAHVYLDAGHAAWLSADEAARRIQQVGTEHLAGFALNVSNYRTTADSRAYGEQISAATGGLRYVVDTSRNGAGPSGSEWCNPRGRALGDAPTLVADGTALDALLWVKRPGESDGTCNGGPAAGAWWPEIARELAANAG